MPTKLVEQAVLKHLRETCVARNIQVPSDPLDFLNRARVVFLDRYGRPIDVGAALVSWEDS